MEIEPRQLSLDQLLAIAELLGSEVGLAMAKKQGIVHTRFGDFSIGQITAALIKLLSQIGPDHREAFVQDLIHGVVENVELAYFRKLVDENGRCIPDRSIVTAEICKARSSEFMIQNHEGLFDFFELLNHWKSICQVSAGDAWDLNAAFGSLEARVEQEPAIKNLLQGPYFPVILPPVPEGFQGNKGKNPGYGQYLNQILFPVLSQSYTGCYPEFKIEIERDCREPFSSNIKVLEARHARLFQDLLKGPIFGILFPACMHGFSPLAQQQMVKLMPDDFSLMGPIEAMVATSLYPSHFAAGNKCLPLDCSAVKDAKDKYYLLMPDDRELRIIRHNWPATTNGVTSGGLFLRLPVN